MTDSNHQTSYYLRNLNLQTLDQQNDEIPDLLDFAEFQNFYNHLIQVEQSENTLNMDDWDCEMKDIPLTLRKSRKYSCCQSSGMMMNTFPGFPNQVPEDDQKIINFGQELPPQINEPSHIAPQLEEKKQLFKQFVFVRKQLKRLKKNTNVPKFISRIFMKYFKQFANKEELTLLTHHVKVSQNLMNRNSNNFSIADLVSLLRNQNDNEDLRKRNQQILSEIIREKFQHEIMQNKYVQLNRKTYMMALKVYTIRCRSKTLTQRVQTL